MQSKGPEIWDVPHVVILLTVFCNAYHFGVPHSKVGCPTFWDSEVGRSVNVSFSVEGFEFFYLNLDVILM